MSRILIAFAASLAAGVAVAEDPVLMSAAWAAVFAGLALCAAVRLMAEYRKGALALRDKLRSET